MDIIYNIIVFIGAILQIILFFKIWGATNDIRKIRNEICKPQQPKEEKPTAPEVRMPTTSTRSGFNVGDWVTSSDNAERLMYIVSIDNNGDYQCSTPEGDYVGTFSKNDLREA